MFCKKVTILFFGPFYSMVFGFEIPPPSCVYNKDGPTIDWPGEQITVDFFVPWAWDFNDQLNLIITNHVNLVLQHPLKSKKSQDDNTELLSIDYVRMGWNRMFVSYNFNDHDLVIKDSERKIWFKKYLGPISKIKVTLRGLYAFVNCNEAHRYFKVSSINYKVPLTFKNGKTSFTVYSDTKSAEVGINLSRRTIRICKQHINGLKKWFSLTNDDCEDSHKQPFLFFIFGEYNISVQDVLLDQNFVRYGNFTYADFLIHSLNSVEFWVITLIHLSSSLNAPYKNFLLEAPDSFTDQISMPVILLIVVNVIAFVSGFILLSLCISERKQKNAINKSKINNLSGARELGVYELNNSLYENIQSRLNKAVLGDENLPDQKPEIYQSSEYELQNTLYEDFESRNK